MEARELLEVNLTPEKIGLVSRFPRCFRDYDLTPTAQDLLAYAYGVGARKDKKTGEWTFSPLNTTYKQLREELGSCYSSTQKAFKDLETHGIIKRSRNADGTTAVKIVEDKLNVQRGYDAVPLYLQTVKVQLNGKGRWRRIPRRARRVLAYLMNEGEVLKEYRYVGSISDIARKLGMPRSTVYAAIVFLIDAGLIERPEDKKGDAKSHKQSVYYISETLYKYKEEGKLARMSPKAQERELEKRRKEYYEKRPKERSKMAENYARWYAEHKDRKAIDKELGKLGKPLAVAELSGDLVRLAALQTQESKLKAELQAWLKSFNYDPRLERPEAYMRCGECRDTGQKADGVLCTCWKRAVRW